tara:strand:- start:248 stop:409 length:162 start_codon:yes stop_codon:yes gene_type:complete
MAENKQGPYKVMLVLDHGLGKKLRLIAKQEDRSVSAQVRVFVRQSINKREEQN